MLYSTQGASHVSLTFLTHIDIFPPPSPSQQEFCASLQFLSLFTYALYTFAEDEGHGPSQPRRAPSWSSLTGRTR